MKIIKAIFPLIAAIGVFFLASASPMWKQINQNNLLDKEIKSIPIEGFKQ